MWAFLGDHLSQSVFIGLAAVVILLKFRRYRSVGGAAVGAASSAATTLVVVVVSLFALVALGYWEPPVGKIVGDALAAGKAFYDLVGEWVLRQTVERLEDIAAA